MRKGCADVGGCDDSIANGGAGCHLCDVIAKLPQPRRLRLEEDEGRPQDNPERDGDPKLAGERKRGNLAFEKRTRKGPHR